MYSIQNKINIREAIKKFKKIAFRILLSLILLLLVLGIVVSLPSVQTKIAQHFTNELNEQYKININIEEATVTIFGGVKLKKVFIKDYKNDTLIFVKTINTNILDVNKLTDGDLLFGNLRLDGLVFNMKGYKGEKDYNLDKFIDAFEDGTKSTKPFLMRANRIFITNSRYILTDENREIPKDLDIKKLNTSLENFQILGPNVDFDIVKMSFLDHRGIFVENLSSKFIYNKKSILLKNLDLITEKSIFTGDIYMNYDRDKGDFSDFNNKVQFDIKIDTASISTNDIHYFYKELAKNKQFEIQSKIFGTLNDLHCTNLNLKDNNNTQIVGNVNFKNIFGKENQPFYMKGDFSKIASNYDNLTSLLPNVLGKKLPSSLKKMGQFFVKGKTEITAKTIFADVSMKTALGNLNTNLKMSNIDNIDNTNYIGNIVLDNFNIGSFLNQKDAGKVSLNVVVEGKGFTQKYLKTSFKGVVSQVFYNGYNYVNVVLNGNFKKPIFNGQFTINDPNLKMDFNGIIDLSKAMNHFNFDTNIDFANLKKLNFIKDSVSVFKGNIKTNLIGSNIDDLAGKINFYNINYKNKKNNYQFDDFEIQSSFDDRNIRTINLNSPDIIEGQIVGKFKFELLQKMLENSVGSLYANYRPNNIQKGQFLKFDFKIYNKIIDIFYPGIEIGNNTKFHGNMSSDNDEFKLNFSSPKIAAFENYFDKINITIDNKNPLFNTFIEMDSISTKHYKIRDFSLLNLTIKDTLYLRSEFKGGDKNKDFFNLNMYHTIDKNNKNVVGIKKSEVKFKDNLWFLNEKESDDNKIIFDKNFKDFIIENISLSHQNQLLNLFGTINGKENKNLTLNFENVDLQKVTPKLEDFNFNGFLNGSVKIQQENSVYKPNAILQIEGLKVNDNLLGKMNLDVVGNEDFKNFSINSKIENENVKSFNALGNLIINDNGTDINLDLDFDRFNLGILSMVGGSTITNIKGFASGKAKIKGNVEDFDMNGRLFVDDAGLKIPYLNLDYKFENQSVVDVTKTKFIFNNISIQDTKFFTKGNLTGVIKHNNFGDWALDLGISSNNIVALDTQDSEETPYYGKAFIKGTAQIYGSVDALTINVNAQSNKGTDIKIPVSDETDIGDSNYIHFISPKEKENKQNGIIEKQANAGLSLNFDLDITKDANIEVILNRDSKHGMKGNGYGTLQLAINTLGKFEMTGDFQIWSGKYNFKYGGLIDKSFDVKKGGSIQWNGNPLRAELNIEATYSKINANPGVLLENPSFNKQVPVVVTIGITGNMSQPETDFNIDFPTVNNVLKSEIQTKLEDKQIRQKQALILLGSGSFLSQDGLDQSTLAYNNLFEKAGHLFDDLLNDDESKIKTLIAYNQADRTTTGNPVIGSRVDVSFSTQVSDKIMINGKVGVPVGGVNESAIVGNIEISYRVNEDGSMNLKVYNRENEINYIGEGIGYTQGLGISYEVDFDMFSELVNRIFKTKIQKNKDIEKPKQENEPIKNTKESVKMDLIMPGNNRKEP